MSRAPSWLDRAGLDGRVVDLAGLPVLVAGAGADSSAAARVLRDRGADVRLAVDEHRVDALEDAALVVATSALRPSSALVSAAGGHEIPVWGEVELAWRLRPGDRPAPWLAVAGSHGRGSAVTMLAAMLRAGGLRTAVAGAAHAALLDAVTADEANDVVVVELSGSDLHRTASMRAHASVVLNVAAEPDLAHDQLDWHGSYAGYVADLGRVHTGVEVAAVYNVSDERTEELVREAEVAEGARAIGFGLGVPRVGELGVVEEVLVDRAFVADRRNNAEELGTLEDLVPLTPERVAEALAAAALARSLDVPAAAVREGLRATRA